MKKILVVFTGGTIGSVISDCTINTSGGAGFKLLQLFERRDQNADPVHFDALQPLQILSENLAPPAWKVIIEAIESAQPGNYDGIIVTHGTDTLAYTACALSFYFHALAKPLLLVSSDYPLENPKGNGLANFSCAVEFIRRQAAHGVFVPYRNAGQSMLIHCGARLTCSWQLTGDFYSVQNKPFLKFDGQHFIPAAFSEENKQEKSAVWELKPEFSSRILMVKPYPGLDYSDLNLTNVQAVLHDLYHSGTACATKEWGEQHSLAEFLQRCRHQGIPVYLAPVCKSENAYASTRELLAHGAEIIWNMSIEAAYVKLMLAYGNFTGPGEIADFLSHPLAFEEIALT